MKKYYNTATNNLKRFEKNIYDLMYPKASSSKKQAKWPLQEVKKSRIEEWILRIRSQLFPENNKNKKNNLNRSYNNNYIMR